MSAEQDELELDKLAKDIAKNLGSEWEGSYQKLYGWKHIAQVARSDGALLEICFAGAGRVEISGQLIGPSKLYSSEHKSITVALSRGVEVIVKEIKRRLLEEYLPAHTKAILDDKRDKEFEAECSRTLNELAAVIKSSTKGGNIYFTRPIPPALRDYGWRDCMRGTVKVSSGSNGELTLVSCPVPLLAKLLQVINDYAEVKDER